METKSCLRAVTAYAVLESVDSRSASLTVSRALVAYDAIAVGR